MTLKKESQFLNPDGFRLTSDELADLTDNQLASDVSDLQVSLELDPDTEEEAEFLVDEDAEISGEIKLENDNTKIEEEFNFSLPLVPGGLNQDDLDVEPAEIVVEDENEAIDPWSWGKSLTNFVEWFKNKVASVPQHSGQGESGCIRAISFLKKCVDIGRHVCSKDINNEVNDVHVEKIIDEALAGIARLEARLSTIQNIKKDKFKAKKASIYDAEDEIEELYKQAQEEDGIVKEASTGPTFGIQVDYFISNMARIIINGSISGSHSAEVTYFDLAKKFDFTPREKHQVINLVRDMGFSIFGDRFYGPEEAYDPTSSDNYDYSASYQS